MKTTLKEIKRLAATLNAINATMFGCQDYDKAKAEEGFFECIAYSVGTYGLTGKLLRGHNTGRLYAITARTSAVFIFS